MSHSTILEKLCLYRNAFLWLIYPGRIPKFNRDLKRAVPKTHLKSKSQQLMKVGREWDKP